MVDENTNMGPGMGMSPVMPAKKKMSIGKILALVGGILLIVGFILPMVTVSVDYSMYGITVSETSSSAGIRLALGDNMYAADGSFEEISYPIFFAVPLMGILAIVLVMLKPAMMKLIGGIMGILGVVCAFIGYMMVSSDLQPIIDMVEALGGTASVGMGIGLILAMVGGILALVGGLLAFKQAKSEGA